MLLDLEPQKDGACSLACKLGAVTWTTGWRWATIDVRLDQEIGTKSSKVGDSFSATVVNAVVAQNGATAVPA